jgi:hypothetical protein
MSVASEYIYYIICYINFGLHLDVIWTNHPILRRYYRDKDVAPRSHMISRLRVEAVTV